MFHRLLTIGHSNHSAERFLELLQRQEVTAIADVRSSPYSAYNPQFNREVLAKTLQAAGVAYVWLGAELGARRTEPDCYVDGQVRYDRVRRSPLFAAGLRRVQQGLEKFTIALMCAERDPLECHRLSLICRRLREDIPGIEHVRADATIESQSELETRMLRLLGLPERDLFRDRAELVEAGYRKLEDRVAFRGAAEGAVPTR